MRRILFLSVIAVSLGCTAQVQTGGEVTRKSATAKEEKKNVGVTDRMQSFYTGEKNNEASLEYVREIYRNLDLTKPANAVLYYPEDIIDGQKNLFRIILELVLNGQLPAYEYLDGREVFTDQYRINPGEMLERFGIYGMPAKGSTDKNPKYIVEEADVPAGRVLNYYIIEDWKFDRLSNAMKTKVEAICPILDREGDYGDSMKYPMFWVKFSDLRPFLANTFVFADDDNNLARYSLDDYFALKLYDGEIYKTKNLRNLTLEQMHPDPDDLKQAQDSIDARLKDYGKNLWVPTREEYLASKEKEATAKQAEDEIPERTTVVATKEKKSAVRSRKPKKNNVSKSTANTENASAVKSVRRRKR